MQSKLPIDSEYVDHLKRNTASALDGLLEVLRDGPASSHYDRFAAFRTLIGTLRLDEIAADFPAIEGGPYSVLAEWDYSTDPVSRETWCRIYFYHQTYFDIVSKFSRYYRYRIKVVTEAPDRAAIEERITQALAKRRKTRKRGYKRHPIFFWTGTFYD